MMILRYIPPLRILLMRLCSETEKGEEEQGIFSVVFVQLANWLVTADANITDRIVKYLTRRERYAGV